MGGGGLRILPHKKWHVWRRDNIERVLRDEREQEEKQQLQDEKQRRLDQERRAQQLATDAPDPQEHVNLFQIEETLAANPKSSKKKKDEADTLKRHGQLPWYAKGNEAKQLTARQERKRKRELEEKDPLRHMRPKEGTHERDEEPYGDGDRRKYSARYDHSTERDRREDGEQSKKRKRHSTDSHKSQKEKLMQELRREREMREAAERRRAERLLHG